MSRKFFPILLLVSALLLPTLAVSADAHCDIAAPDSATTVNMIGWTYPIIDFYADELKRCNDVDTSRSTRSCWIPVRRTARFSWRSALAPGNMASS